MSSSNETIRSLSLIHPHLTGLIVVGLVVIVTLVAAITAISLFYCIYKCKTKKIKQNSKISKESGLIAAVKCPTLKVLEPTPLKILDKKELSKNPHGRTNKLLPERPSSKTWCRSVTDKPKYQIEITRREETSSIYSCIPDTKTSRDERNSPSSYKSPMLQPIALFSMNPKAEGCEPLSISFYCPSPRPNEMMDFEHSCSSSMHQTGGIGKDNVSASLQTIIPMNEKDEIMKQTASINTICSFPSNTPLRKQRLEGNCSEEFFDIIQVDQLGKQIIDTIIDIAFKDLDLVSDLKSSSSPQMPTSPSKMDSNEVTLSLSCLESNEKVNFNKNELVVPILDLTPRTDERECNNNSILDLMSLASPYLNITSLPASPACPASRGPSSSQASRGPSSSQASLTLEKDDRSTERDDQSTI